jgi:hypothetical protein
MVDVTTPDENFKLRKLDKGYESVADFLRTEKVPLLNFMFNTSDKLYAA